MSRIWPAAWGRYGPRHRPVDASRGAPVALEPRAPAARPAGQDVGVVEEPIQERGDGGRVAEELSPVLDWTIRSDQGGGSFVAPHDDLQQILGRGVGSLRVPRSSMMSSGTVVTWRR